MSMGAANRAARDVVEVIGTLNVEGNMVIPFDKS